MSGRPSPDGWLLIGFKLDLGLIAPPLLFVGALLRLFAGARLAHTGLALAGFSLLFLGIDAMKHGLSGFEGALTPADFPGDDLPGRLQLVLIGVAITLVTQSSSAGVATALVALSAGAISLTQAAAMVIGMDVGTTATAALAALGGSTAMRRTGYAHVVCNLLTGTMAFLLLVPFAAIASGVGSGAGNAELALVAFHTGFNLLGVIMVLPFATGFARLIERLVAESEAPYLRRLDARLLSESAAAIDAASATIAEMSGDAFAVVSRMLDRAGDQRAEAERLSALHRGIDAVRHYLAQVATDAEAIYPHRRHVAALHALDHLARLVHRAGQAERIAGLRGEPRLRRLSGLVGGIAAEGAMVDHLGAIEERIDRVRRLLWRQRDAYRAATLEAAAARRLDAPAALARLDGIRWLDRVSYHLWRIAHHVGRSAAAEPPAAAAPEIEVEIRGD